MGRWIDPAPLSGNRPVGYARAMYDFAPAPDAPKAALYANLAQAAEALTAGERDAVANMANVAALVWQFVPRLNWAGFYRTLDDAQGGSELVLGPFIGKPACLRIPFGQGVCGTAAASGETQLVADVHAFPGHIACDAASRSELVVPVLRDGRVLAVIDLDSPDPARFDAEDAAGIEELARIVAALL
jgi:L-methionine (R)-S-oxide reductase